MGREGGGQGNAGQSTTVSSRRSVLEICGEQAKARSVGERK